MSCLKQSYVNRRYFNIIPTRDIFLFCFSRLFIFGQLFVRTSCISDTYHARLNANWFSFSFFFFFESRNYYYSIDATSFGVTSMLATGLTCNRYSLNFGSNSVSHFCYCSVIVDPVIHGNCDSSKDGLEINKKLVVAL